MLLSYPVVVLWHGYHGKKEQLPELLFRVLWSHICQADWGLERMITSSNQSLGTILPSKIHWINQLLSTSWVVHAYDNIGIVVWYVSKGKLCHFGEIKSASKCCIFWRRKQLAVPRGRSVFQAYVKLLQTTSLAGAGLTRCEWKRKVVGHTPRSFSQTHIRHQKQSPRQRRHAYNLSYPAIFLHKHFFQKSHTVISYFVAIRTHHLIIALGMWPDRPLPKIDRKDSANYRTSPANIHPVIRSK